MNRVQLISSGIKVASIFTVLMLAPCSVGIAGLPLSPPGASEDMGSTVSSSARDDQRALTSLSTRTEGAYGSDNYLIAHIDSSGSQQGIRTLPHKTAGGLPHVLPEKYLLTIDKAIFTCNEYDCDHYYRTCGLAIDYTVSSERIKEQNSEAEIVCKAAIIYHTKSGYRLNGLAGPEISHHTFSHHGSVSSHLSLIFYFSEYEQVTGVQLDNMECRAHRHEYISRRAH
jgi:hypothetical protein